MNMIFVNITVLPSHDALNTHSQSYGPEIKRVQFSLSLQL